MNKKRSLTHNEEGGSCVKCVETLEKALKDLDEFRSLACRSYDELSLLSSALSNSSSSHIPSC